MQLLPAVIHWLNENVSKQSIPAAALPATELPLEEGGVEYDKEN
jgi:hypothetical protein